MSFFDTQTAGCCLKHQRYGSCHMRSRHACPAHSGKRRQVGLRIAWCGARREYANSGGTEIRLEATVARRAHTTKTSDQFLWIVVAIGTHSDRPPAVANCAGCRSWIRVVRMEMRLAPRTGYISLDPGMVASVNDVGSYQCDFPRTRWSFLIKINGDVIVEVVGLLASVVDVSHFFATHDEFRALADFHASRDRPAGRAYFQFKPVLPRVPKLKLIVGRFASGDFPD